MLILLGSCGQQDVIRAATIGRGVQGRVVMGNRPRIKPFTNKRIDARLFVYSWSIRGWSLGAKVNAFPLAAVRLGDVVRGRNSAFEPREAERQVEGLFESPLNQSFRQI